MRTIAPLQQQTLTSPIQNNAAAKGRTADVELLLRGGAEVNGLNRFGRTALQVMMMGSTPVARVLLKHGADPNVADGRTGSSPLHDAAREGFVDTARLLVEHLADPQARDNAKCRPVDLARDNGHDDVVAFLESL
uniref:Cyclin-dependent kinase inhibitor 2A/B (p15, inhibits CDK4) n=1 Tax=Scophthalmus maximus TaxID=52904 RepID=A0A8D3C9X3_SCOMX